MVELSAGVGRMGGGSITVNGNVEDYAGEDMTGGRIHVTGKAGNWTGRGMRGGIIKVKGDITSFGDFCKHGEIWEKGVKKKG